MGEPFMLNGVPSDFYVDREERHLAPEEVYEERLRGDALAASKDFFVLLHPFASRSRAIDRSTARFDVHRLCARLGRVPAHLDRVRQEGEQEFVFTRSYRVDVSRA